MITQTYTIKAYINDVWAALTNAHVIEQWSGAKANMSDEDGADFSLWDGDIWGKNSKVARPYSLVQEWYGGKWERPSVVSFTLTENDGETTVQLVHDHVPEAEEKDFADGWRDYYMIPIKELLER